LFPEKVVVQGVTRAAASEDPGFQSRASSPVPKNDNRIGNLWFANPTRLPDGTYIPPASICTASYIGENLWLTAAHCVEPFPDFYGYIEQSEGEAAGVKDVTVLDSGVDIALIEVGPGISADPFSIAVDPATVGAHLTLIGYADNRTYASEALVEVTGEPSAVTLSNKTYQNVYESRSARLSRSCSGDSGGAVYRGDTLYAVHTGGEQNPDCTNLVDSTMWHTDLASSRDAIVEKLQTGDDQRGMDNERSKIGLEVRKYSGLAEEDATSNSGNALSSSSTVSAA